jgi:hypothetical protein
MFGGVGKGAGGAGGASGTAPGGVPFGGRMLRRPPVPRDRPAVSRQRHARGRPADQLPGQRNGGAHVRLVRRGGCGLVGVDRLVPVGRRDDRRHLLRQHLHLRGLVGLALRHRRAPRDHGHLRRERHVAAPRRDRRDGHARVEPWHRDDRGGRGRGRSARRRVVHHRDRRRQHVDPRDPRIPRPDHQRCQLVQWSLLRGRADHRRRLRRNRGCLRGRVAATERDRSPKQAHARPVS